MSSRECLIHYFIFQSISTPLYSRKNFKLYFPNFSFVFILVLCFYQTFILKTLEPQDFKNNAMILYSLN